MIRKNLKFLLIFSVGLLIFISVLDAFRHNVQIIKIKKSSNIETLPTGFKCPETPWVDCMPTVGAKKIMCSAEYLDWAKQNCPNFKGVAY